jgi:hypothetical protein
MYFCKRYQSNFYIEALQHRKSNVDIGGCKVPDDMTCTNYEHASVMCCILLVLVVMDVITSQRDGCNYFHYMKLLSITLRLHQGCKRRNYMNCITHSMPFEMLMESSLSCNCVPGPGQVNCPRRRCLPPPSWMVF